jgi:phosphatidate cytidylyltransferase
MTPLPPAKRFNWVNLAIRALSALVLAPAVLWVLWTGGWWLLALIAVAAALMAIEWAMMSAPQAPGRTAVAVTCAVLAAAFVADFGFYRIMWLALVLCAGAAALIARRITARPADAAFGVLYIGGPCLALMWLREADPLGDRWTIMVLAVAWSADIAAFLVGNALKGPKLWPQFSPNKTWSGFVGGLLAATLAAAAAAHFLPMGLGTPVAMALGLFAGLATMAGDLWESVLKRRFGVKDSGDLIPGHGGLLDRVDGLMFAFLAVAAARLLVKLRWPH